MLWLYNPLKRSLVSTDFKNKFYILYCITSATETSVYREKKHPYDCFTSLSEDKSIPMTALWCPAFSNHG